MAARHVPVLASGKRCCLCNGANARCTRCSCVKKKIPCVSCQPGKTGCCQNKLCPTNEGNVSCEPRVCDTDSILTSSVQRPEVSRASQIVSDVNQELLEANSNNNVPGPVVEVSGVNMMLDGHQLVNSESSVNVGFCANDGEVDVERLMTKAYGEGLVQSGGHNFGEFWFESWRKVVNLNGMHYDIPGGSIGRRYVDMLKGEVDQLGAGNYNADR